MKNAIVLFLSFSCFILKAQLPASTTPQNKKAVIEHFTALYCGYSPNGDKIASDIYKADPNNVVLIQIHSGGYANVATGEPDFKTSAGNLIDPMPGMKITGYPAADVNRMNFGTINPSYSQSTVTPYGMAQNRNTWTVTVPMVKSQPADCNVALQGTVDAVSRVLLIEAQVYYTNNSPASTNSLTIMLLEDSIPGIIKDWGYPTSYFPVNYNPDGSYNHNCVLRACITPTFGTTVFPTTIGTTFNATFSYTIPPTFGAAGKTTQALLGRMKLAAFVTETNTLTSNGTYGPISIVNYQNALDIGISNVTTTDGNFKSDLSVCSGPIGSNFKFVNYGSATVTQAVFSYNVNGGPAMTYTWSGSLAPMTMAKTITLTPIPMASTGANTLNISVLSVNGSSDQNPLNDNFSRVIPNAVTANTLTMQMDLYQDRYGSEIGWGVYDEVTSASVIVVPVGTYSDLPSNGIALHSHTFVVNPNTCYKLIVVDSYGDGINAGYGAGYYYFKSGLSTILASSGQYGFGETKLFKSANILNIMGEQSLISRLDVYPNPAINYANLELELAQNEDLNIVIVDALGRVVFSEQKNMEAGSHKVNLNTESWSAGVYNINISTASGSLSKKIIKE